MVSQKLPTSSREIATTRPFATSWHLFLRAARSHPKGLENRIRSAVRLIFLSVCCCLCGVAALKRPERRYRKDVSSKSGIPLPEAEYPFELGWVFVMPSARGRRFSLDLTQAALSAAGTAGVFATSRTDNIPMHAVLTKFGFVPAGHPYPSTRGSHQLQLFVRRSAQRGAPGKRSPDVAG